MYKIDEKDYKDNTNTLSSMNCLNKSKSTSMDSNDTLDTVDSCSYTIRSRANSNTSSNGNSSNGNSSRNPSIELDLNADKKQNNFLSIEKKKEYIETNYIEIKQPRKRIRDEELLPLSKSPNVISILEKIPGLNLNKILKERYNDVSNNIIDFK